MFIKSYNIHCQKLNVYYYNFYYVAICLEICYTRSGLLFSTFSLKKKRKKRKVVCVFRIDEYAHLKEGKLFHQTKTKFSNETEKLKNT